MHRQRGATLLEVLVAIIVLSFGVLGMVGLQAASLQANREARLQAKAIRLAGELAELMRANPDVAGKPTAAENPYLLADFQAISVNTTQNCVGTASPCTPLQIATADMADWQRRVIGTGTDAEASDVLPGPRVVVCADSEPYSDQGIPRWDCDGKAGILQIKIGWTRSATNRAATGDAAFERVTGEGSRPSVVIPVMVGSV